MPSTDTLQGPAARHRTLRWFKREEAGLSSWKHAAVRCDAAARCNGRHVELHPKCTRSHLNPHAIVSERVGVDDSCHWFAFYYERDGARRQATRKAAIGRGYLQRAVVDEAGVGGLEDAAAAATT